MWNDLPADIKLCKSIYKFKKNVRSLNYSCIDMKYELIALVSWFRVIYVFYFRIKYHTFLGS